MLLLTVVREAFCKGEQLMKTLCWATETVSADPQMGDLDQLSHTSKAQGTRWKKEFKSWRIGDAVKWCLLDMMCATLMASPAYDQASQKSSTDRSTSSRRATMAAEGGRIIFLWGSGTMLQ